MVGVDVTNCVEHISSVFKGGGARTDKVFCACEKGDRHFVDSLDLDVVSIEICGLPVWHELLETFSVMVLAPVKDILHRVRLICAILEVVTK